MGILTAIRALNSSWAADNGIELSVRIGIDTGMAVVGQVGDTSRYESLALGKRPTLRQGCRLWLSPTQFS